MNRMTEAMMSDSLNRFPAGAYFFSFGLGYFYSVGWFCWGIYTLLPPSRIT